MIFFGESGIAVTEDIKKAISEGREQYNGRLRAFGKAWDIPQTSLNYLLGIGGRERKQITWDAWPPIRRYLESIGLIKRGDIDYLVPSELRELARQKKNDEPKTAKLKMRRESAYKLMGRELQEGENPDDLVGVTVECLPEGQKKSMTRDGVMLASARFVSAIMVSDSLDDSQKVAVTRLFKSFFPDDAAELVKTPYNVTNI